MLPVVDVLPLLHVQLVDVLLLPLLHVVVGDVLRPRLLLRCQAEIKHKFNL